MPVETSVTRPCIASLVALAIAAAVSACGGSDRTVAFDAPFYRSLDAVASQATLVVQGTVTGQKGQYEIKGEDAVFANDVFEFEVTDVLGESGRVSVSPGDILNVGMFTVWDEADGVGNLDELRETVESYSGALREGVPMILFLAPVEFTPDVVGWGVSGGYYGVIEIGASPFSRAPLGPLAGAAIDGAKMTAALAALGTKPPPTSTN